MVSGGDVVRWCGCWSLVWVKSGVEKRFKCLM